MQTLLYAQLADQLIDDIRNGAYQVGEKLPSVRNLAKKERISIATVNSAYAILEERGWAQPKPKSGYFVSRAQYDPVGLPRSVRLRPRPKAVSTGELVLQTLRESSIDVETNFANAIPELRLPIANEVQRAYTRLSRGKLGAENGYNSPEGLFELRQQITRRAIDAGIHISPDAVITTSGAHNAIAHALHAVTTPGDIIAVESPCYFGLLQQIEALGLQAIEIPADSATGISVEALKLALQKWPIKTILSISNFSNPLGCCVPDAHRREIIKLAQEYDISIIEDDIYGELQFDGRRPKTFKAFDPDGRVIWCSSISKTMEPRLRVGWIAPGRYYDEVLRQKIASCLSSPQLPEAVTAEVISKGSFDKHLRQVRALYKQRASHMMDLAVQYFPEEMLASNPQGGLVSWFEMPRHLDATDLYYSCRDKEVRIAPGELFSISGLYRNCFRLSYANPWSAEREAGIKIIGDTAKQMLLA